MNKDEIEDKIKSLSRKRDETLIEAEKIQSQLLILAEQFYELDNEYIKVICPGCGGIGYMKIEDNKKRVCQICQGKEYTWMKKYGKVKK